MTMMNLKQSANLSKKNQTNRLGKTKKLLKAAFDLLCDFFGMFLLIFI